MDHPCAETRRLSGTIKRENRSSGSTWAQDIEKKVRTGQVSQTKKSQGGNISPSWGEAPTSPIETKICVVGHLADVITCAKFQDDIFRGYDFTADRISHFLIDFCMGLTTVQHDCAAYDKKRTLCLSSSSSQRNVTLYITAVPHVQHELYVFQGVSCQKGAGIK